METPIQIIWWIGLLGALIPTVIILQEATLIVRTLRDIYTLAEITRGASGGILENVSLGTTLETLGEPAAGVGQATAQLAVAAASVEPRLASRSGQAGKKK